MLILFWSRHKTRKIIYLVGVLLFLSAHRDQSFRKMGAEVVGCHLLWDAISGTINMAAAGFS